MSLGILREIHNRFPTREYINSHNTHITQQISNLAHSAHGFVIRGWGSKVLICGRFILNAVVKTLTTGACESQQEIDCALLSCARFDRVGE